jgi:streptogrisin C
VYALWERINTGGEWAPQVIYQTDDEAAYQGTTYRAIQGHQSQAGWEPPNQPALWEEVN